ncbi:MAG: hypothetical protein OXJ52_01790 [Oligoflexia bacterium]|nr:hypothetical protein [Oligoflexia bacterium]
MSAERLKVRSVTKLRTEAFESFFNEGACINFYKTRELSAYEILQKHYKFNILRFIYMVLY